MNIRANDFQFRYLGFDTSLSTSALHVFRALCLIQAVISEASSSDDWKSLLWRHFFIVKIVLIGCFDFV